MTSVASALITTTQKRSFAAARLQNASASLTSLRVASSNGNDRSLNSAASSTLTPLPLPLLTPSPVPARSLHCAASGSIGDAKYPRSVPAWTTPLGAYPRRASITLHACWNAPSARRILPRSPSGRIAGDASATTHRSVEKSALARGSGRDRESGDDRVSCPAPPPPPPPPPPLTRRVALRVAIPGVVGSERDRGERGGDDDDDGAFGGVGARRHVARARERRVGGGGTAPRRRASRAAARRPRPPIATARTSGLTRTRACPAAATRRDATRRPAARGERAASGGAARRRRVVVCELSSPPRRLVQCALHLAPRKERSRRRHSSEHALPSLRAGST